MSLSVSTRAALVTMDGFIPGLRQSTAINRFQLLLLLLLLLLCGERRVQMGDEMCRAGYELHASGVACLTKLESGVFS